MRPATVRPVVVAAVRCVVPDAAVREATAVRPPVVVAVRLAAVVRPPDVTAVREAVVRPLEYSGAKDYVSVTATPTVDIP